MIQNKTLASLMEADYPRLQTAFFDRFYKKWLDQGLDPAAAELQAMARSEQAAFDEAERRAEEKLSAQ